MTLCKLYQYIILLYYIYDKDYDKSAIKLFFFYLNIKKIIKIRYFDSIRFSVPKRLLISYQPLVKDAAQTNMVVGKRSVPF